MASSTFTPRVASNPDQPFILRLKLEVFGEYYKTYCIWAYPKLRKPHTEIYIRTTPALVSYVLGDDWETRLGTDSHIYDDKTTWTEADEIALAMRILKAGGAVLDLSDAHPEAHYEALDREWLCFEKQRECIFGWPDTGGVWVLHLMAPTITGDSEADIEAIEDMMDLVAVGKESAEALRAMTEGPLDLKDLMKAESMTEYCAKSKELGAKFYRNPADSMEVEKYGLLDTNQLTRPWN
ncbi:hypothetical protein K469DRAFT_751705 [Zopfia rhizophila CBS 207.26]|uniref:Uncharacterized protein n=1 Tax=Zopfia rhizophila CBS 207.26 TaxID=1314779 RepID=A0A6A6DXP1_9PEZI|nr:hypothetical protein K469DRAFT_751705 [Zopfia rhizophila CBS 207.26]